MVEVSNGRLKWLSFILLILLGWRLSAGWEFLLEACRLEQVRDVAILDLSG